MLTENEYDIIVANVKRCSVTKSLPFIWNSGSQRLQAEHSWLSGFIALTTAFIYCICIPNAFIGTYYIYHESHLQGTSLPGEFFIGVVYFVGFLILFGFHLNFVHNKDNITRWFNGLMEFNLRYNPEENKLRCSRVYKLSSKPDKVKEWILLAVGYLIYFATVTVSGITITGVDLPFSLYSKVPLEYRGPTVFCLVAIFEFYYHFRASQTWVSVLFFQVTWISSAVSWLRVVCFSKSVSLTQKLRVNCTLTVLQTQFCESFLRVANPGMLFFFLMLIVLGNYGTIRFYDTIHPIAYLFFPYVTLYFHVAMVGACSMASKVHALSAKFLERDGFHSGFEVEGSGAQQEQELAQLWRQYKRSRRPLEFKISQYFPIRKSTLLILFYWTTTHTVNLLLVAS